MPHKRQPPLYRVYVLGQHDDEPRCVFTDANADLAQREADAHLRSWVTSHSTECAPTAWVEFDFKRTVYEAWIERRRLRDPQTKQTFIETPVQFWDDELDHLRKGADSPVRTEWFAQHLSHWETLEPLVNPEMARN
jgi:hypothetical protein